MRLPWSIVLMLGMAACSSPAATNQAARIKGYGVEAVGGTSLDGMLARCEEPGPPSDPADRGRSLDAECSQLHRALHNQPGNSVATGAMP